MDLIDSVRFCQAKCIWSRLEIFRACEQSGVFAEGVAREAKHFTEKWVQLAQEPIAMATELEEQWRYAMGDRGLCRKENVQRLSPKGK